MGNGMIGAVCGAAVAMVVCMLAWSSHTTPLAIAALIGGGLGAVTGAYGHGVATVNGMRLLRYLVVAVIFGAAAMLYHGAPAFAAAP